MNKIIKIVPILALLSTFYAGAMERPVSNSQNSPIQKLHSDHIQKIILNAGSVDDIGQCTRALSQTNKHLYNTIQNATPSLIQQAPHHTPTSEAQAALAIRTKAARPWLQKNLTDESFNELQIFLDEHLEKINPSQEEFAKVRFLIRSLPQIADCQSCPALFIACDDFSNFAKLRNLLAAGVNVNQTNKGNVTPLTKAIVFNNLELAQELLNAGADITPGSYEFLYAITNQLDSLGGGRIIHLGPIIINTEPISRRPIAIMHTTQTLRAFRNLLRQYQIKRMCSIQ